MKIEIKLDEEQIKKDNIYELEELYQVIDKLFLEENLIKLPDENGSIFYSGTGSNRDMGRIFVCVFALEKSDWFMNYVRTWLLYSSAAKEDENDFDIEDILAQSLAHRNKEKLAI